MISSGLGGHLELSGALLEAYLGQNGPSDTSRNLPSRPRGMGVGGGGTLSPRGRTRFSRTSFLNSSRPKGLRGGPGGQPQAGVLSGGRASQGRAGTADLAGAPPRGGSRNGPPAGACPRGGAPERPPGENAPGGRAPTRLSGGRTSKKHQKHISDVFSLLFKNIEKHRRWFLDVFKMYF